LTGRPSARRIRGAVLVAAVVAVVAGPGAAGAQASSTPDVVAIGPNGHRLPVDPVLLPGEPVGLLVTGFAAEARLTTAIAPVEPGPSPTPAAAGHRRQLRFVVPRSIAPGRHVLVIAGAPAPGASGRPAGTVVFDVPRVVLFAFRIAPAGSGVDAAHATRTAGSATTTSRGLSATGANVLAPTVVGLIAVASGGVLWRLGRRRRVRPRR
jgi:hypothetical protein